MEKKQYLPGFTLRSAAASLFAIFLIAILAHQAAFFAVISDINEHLFPVHTIVVFLALAGMVGLIGAFARYRLLTKPELVCVLFSMLFAAPLLTQGFWHRIVSMTATIPESGNFEMMDAFNEKLWPHGGNLIKASLQQGAAGLSTQGRVEWREEEYDEGRRAVLPVLINSGDSSLSIIRLNIPARQGNRQLIVPGDDHLVSVSFRARELGVNSQYFSRYRIDTSALTTGLFSGNSVTETKFSQKRAFARLGKYAIPLPSNLRDSLVLEFGLIGRGELAINDPRFFNVSTLTSLRKGRKLINAADYAALPESDRAGLLVKPSSLASWQGLKFLAAGYIPLREWLTPLFVWFWLFAMLLLAALAVNVILRRQWLEGERYPMPMARIPLALLGPAAGENSGSIWKQRILWIGFSLAFLWACLKGWHFYNANVPNMEVRIPLLPFFTDPKWGDTFSWGQRFEVNAVFFALCLLMELNVLASFVAGFWLYRLQYWFGVATDLKVLKNYPFNQEQAVGAYLAYGLGILFFARKYLFSVFVAAFSPANTRSAEEEVFSYRTAFLLLAATFTGGALWAAWLNVSVSGILLFFGFLVLVGLVAAKLRAECGTPWGYFAPENAMFFVSMIGGISAFGTGGMMICLIASFFISYTVFYFLPGAQLEMMYVGARYSLRPRHILYTVVLGLLAAFVFGGWSMLSIFYSHGTNNIPSYTWAFDGKIWYFFTWQSDVMTATNQMQGAGAAGGEYRFWGYAFGATVTIVLTVLRQFFAGFWFHPLGYVVSPLKFMEYFWGSALAALIIRWAVLKIGGAATVREKLLPFAVGIFMGAAASVVVFWGIHLWQFLLVETPLYFPGAANP